MEQGAPTEKEAGTEPATEKSSAQDMTESTGVQVSATPAMMPVMRWTCPTCSGESIVNNQEIIKTLERGEKFRCKCRCGQQMTVGYSRIYQMAMPKRAEKLKLIK